MVKWSSFCLFSLFICMYIPAAFASGLGTCLEGQVPGCDGVCGSKAVNDICGVCNGDGPDECGVCNGNNENQDDCGVCFGSNDDKDDCGVCFGDNESRGCDGVCFSNATVDECNVCGGPGPSGCDEVCGSTNDYDSCGVCGGSDDSCEPQRCEYFSGTVTNRRSDSLRRKFNNTRSFTSDDNNQTANEVEYLACVQQWIQEAEDYVRPDGRHHRVRYKTENGKQHVIQRKEKNGNNYDSMIRDYFYRVAEESSNVADGTYNSSGNDSYTFVMDDNCNAIPKDEVSEDQICGAFTISAVTSPISLIWEEGHSTTSMSSFPLNPTETGMQYIWKASSKRPLLVYDPKQTGSIVSASQLFGNWTFFKGTPIASLTNTDSTEAPWENGYEALGTLDADSDGVVSGDELTSLALWFDNNQNGISEKGEVVSVLKKGVQSIQYRGYQKVSGSNDLVVSNGFSRTVDGKLIHADTIDWFVEGSTSRSKLLLSQTLGKARTSLIDTQQASPAHTNTGASFKSTANSLTGLWKWKLQDDIPGVYEKHHLAGVFAFHHNVGTGLVSGHSFSEASLSSQRRNGPAKSFLDVVPLQEIHLSSKGFSFASRSRGGTTRSKAVFSSPHMIKGISTLHLDDGDSFHYVWIAEKIAE